MTDPIAVQEKLRAIMQKHWPAPTRQEDLSDYLACEDAILAAFPELTAPDKDMAEGAQEVIGKWMALTPVALNCAQDVAAFATACVAKATERHRAEVAAAILAAEARVREEIAEHLEQEAPTADRDDILSDWHLGYREGFKAAIRAIRAGGER